MWGVRGASADTHTIESPHTTSDSIVGPSHTWIQPTVDQKQYFRSAFGKPQLGM